MQQKELKCPVCNGNKAEIVGQNVKLEGIFEDKKFLTTSLIVLQCTQCGYYMFFNNTAQFTEKDR